MRTFGGFKFGSEFFYGEVRGEDVQVLAKPYWIDIQPTGEARKVAQVDVHLPVAPSKLIAVGLNYADHIAEMKRTPLGTPLIWFKAPSSLLPHNGTIEIAFPEHQTDFETELGIVIGRPAKSVPADRALDFVFGYTIGLDISDGVPPKVSRPTEPSILFSVTPSASTLATAIYRSRKNNSGAANRSTPTHQLGRSFITMSMLAICRWNCARTARCGRRRGRVR